MASQVNCIIAGGRKDSAYTEYLKNSRLADPPAGSCLTESELLTAAASLPEDEEDQDLAPVRIALGASL